MTMFGVLGTDDNVRGFRYRTDKKRVLVNILFGVLDTRIEHSGFWLPKFRGFRYQYEKT